MWSMPLRWLKPRKFTQLYRRNGCTSSPIKMSMTSQSNSFRGWAMTCFEQETLASVLPQILPSSNTPAMKVASWSPETRGTERSLS